VECATSHSLFCQPNILWQHIFCDILSCFFFFYTQAIQQKADHGYIWQFVSIWIVIVGNYGVCTQLKVNSANTAETNFSTQLWIQWLSWELYMGRRTIAIAISLAWFYRELSFKLLCSSCRSILAVHDG